MKIDDIARLAGVSRSAVSLAFNNKPGISEATRKHILQISETHGYVPRTKTPKTTPKGNPILRFIACKNIDIVTEHYETQPFFNELIHHVTDYARNEGYSLIISSLTTGSLNEEIEALEETQASSGILLLGTNLTPDIIDNVQRVHPNIVVLDTCFEQINANFVSINNYLGGYQAGKHLLSLGHRNIGYVESTIKIMNFIKRKEGFFTALREEGITEEQVSTFSLAPMLVMSQDSFKDAAAAMKELPTVIFCENDYMAISAIKSLQQLGIQVPGQVAIMGFDDILEAKIISPELTTIHVKKNVMAQTAVGLLLNQSAGKEHHRVQILVNTEVIERTSC